MKIGGYKFYLLELAIRFELLILFSGTFEIDRFGIRSSAAEFGSWIASFLWLKKISVFSDDPVRSQLTYLVQDQLGYSLPPFGDSLAGFSDLVPVSYQMKLLFIIRNRKPPQFQ
jgi:hypothetical protein